MAILNATAKSVTNTTLATTLLEDDLDSSSGTNNSSGLAEAIEAAEASNETFVDCGGTILGNSTYIGPKATNLSDIPAKEIFIVIMMLGLWVYSIILTRKAWYRILKE